MAKIKLTSVLKTILVFVLGISYLTGREGSYIFNIPSLVFLFTEELCRLTHQKDILLKLRR